MQSFNNNVVNAVWARTFLAVEISYDFIHFMIREVWLWLGVLGPCFSCLSPDIPLMVTVLCSIVIGKEFVEERARGLHF